MIDVLAHRRVRERLARGVRGSLMSAVAGCRMSAVIVSHVAVSGLATSATWA
jgi:hypothetical protein